MKQSSVATATESLVKAIDRLYLDDVDEQDVEKALTHIENAKNVLK